jgi:hypothetical protein
MPLNLWLEYLQPVAAPLIMIVLWSVRPLPNTTIHPLIQPPHHAIDPLLPSILPVLFNAPPSNHLVDLLNASMLQYLHLPFHLLSLVEQGKLKLLFVPVLVEAMAPPVYTLLKKATVQPTRETIGMLM